MVQTVLAALLALGLGAAFLLVGYRIFLVMLPIWGFFAGLWLGAYGVTWLFGDGFFTTVTGWAFGFGIGILLAIFSYLIFDWGVALVAAAVTGSIVAGALNAGGSGPVFWVTLLAIGIAIAVAYLVERFHLQRLVIITLTVIGGANAIVVGLLLLFGQLLISDFTTAGSTVGPLISSSPLWAILWLALAVGGYFVQLRLNRSYEFSSDRYVEGWG